jgi:hypothetical protein
MLIVPRPAYLSAGTLCALAGAQGTNLLGGGLDVSIFDMSLARSPARRSSSKCCGWCSCTPSAELADQLVDWAKIARKASNGAGLDGPQLEQTAVLSLFMLAAHDRRGLDTRAASSIFRRILRTPASEGAMPFSIAKVRTYCLACSIPARVVRSNRGCLAVKEGAPCARARLTGMVSFCLTNAPLTPLRRRPISSSHRR